MGSHTYRNLILSLLVAFGFLYLAFRNVPLADLGHALSQVDASWLIVAVGVSLMIQVFRAWRWQLELQPLVHVPFGRLWVIVSVALTASIGVAAGGWRIIRTLGLRLTALRPVQGFAAETAAATVLQAASAWGVPVSTTHAITAAIVGAGSVHGKSQVRWHVVFEITLSWLLTLPAAIALGYVYASIVGWVVR